METVEVDVRKLSLSKSNPRRDIDKRALNELKESLRETGLLQPFAVRPLGSGYELVFGLRRVTALRELAEEDESFAFATAIVVDGDADATSVVQLTENLHRRGNKPTEVADAVAYLHKERGMSVDELSSKLALGTSTIRRYITLTRCSDYVRALEDAVVIEEERVVNGETHTSLRKVEGLPLMPLIVLNKLDRALRKNEKTKDKAKDTVVKLAAEAAKKGWGFRRLEEAVKAEIAKLQPKPKVKRKAAQPLSHGATWVTLRDPGTQLGDHDKERIASALRSFLMRLGFDHIELR